MIEFTSIISMPEEKTPLSLDWANKILNPPIKVGVINTTLLIIQKVVVCRGS